MESSSWVKGLDGEIIIVREPTMVKLYSLGYIEWIYDSTVALHHSMPHITKVGKEYLKSH
jgi:hypothetical protein